MPPEDKKIQMAFEPKRLPGNTYNQTLLYLAEQTITANQRDSHHGLVLDPPFQRGAVWSLDQKKQWWETILEDLPRPPLFMNRFDDDAPEGWECCEIVIDGQQRLRATKEFMNDEFRVRGVLWSDVDESTKRRLRMHTTCPVIFTQFKTMRECAELYLLLLRCGTAHTDEEIAKAEDFIKGEQS